MKTLHILTIGLFTLLLSCGKVGSSKIEFDGKTFELPIDVKTAKEKLGLQYGYYSGFFKGNVNDKSIETQLEDYPLFMGSDNDKEESYYDNYIVGVTFFNESKTIEQVKNDFEKQYNKTFKTEIQDFGVTRTLPPFNMTYHYIITDDELFVALKEIERKPDKKKYISISFYKGVSKNELGKYLEYVY
ncbi:hypothetical protein CAP36_16075 [Chitinophagaceae bacterium IBVUCB2]|nr:hypothetical protein CAP36_16075 [Chitinophagaceae bacterium IBVUCB2]